MFRESQFVGTLKDLGGVVVNDLPRTRGVSRATFFNWRSKHGQRALRTGNFRT